MLFSVFVSPNPFSLCVTWVCLGDAVHAPLRGALRYCLLLLGGADAMGGGRTEGKAQKQKNSCAVWLCTVAKALKGESMIWQRAANCLKCESGRQIFLWNNNVCQPEKLYWERVKSYRKMLQLGNVVGKKEMASQSSSSWKRSIWKRGLACRESSNEGQLLEKGQTFWQNWIWNFLVKLEWNFQGKLDWNF